MHSKQKHMIDVYGKLPETFDELGEAVEAVISGFNKTTQLVGLAWSISYQDKVSCSHNAPVGKRTNWGGKDSDTPANYPGMTGRVWYRFDNRPGRFEWSSCFPPTMTYIGTGGGGAYGGLWSELCSTVFRTRSIKPGTRANFKYMYPEPRCFSLDYKIFLSDFPALEKLITDAKNAHDEVEDKAEIWAALNNKYYRRIPFSYNHSFRWEDPTTKAADDAFLKKFKAETANAIQNMKRSPLFV